MCSSRGRGRRPRTSRPGAVIATSDGSVEITRGRLVDNTFGFGAGASGNVRAVDTFVQSAVGDRSLSGGHGAVSDQQSRTVLERVVIERAEVAGVLGGIDTTVRPGNARRREWRSAMTD
jgi:hypothetical protein